MVKSVSFGHAEVVKLVPLLSDYTKEDLKNIYYRKKDMFKIQQKSAKIVMSVQQKIKCLGSRVIEAQLNEQGHSYRGLETFYLDEENENIKEIRKTVKAVLDYQRNHRHEDNAEALALFYSDETKYFRDQALKYGEEDAKAACIKYNGSSKINV